jgi:hypothetical protein
VPSALHFYRTSRGQGGANVKLIEMVDAVLRRTRPDGVNNATFCLNRSYVIFYT